MFQFPVPPSDLLDATASVSELKLDFKTSQERSALQESRSMYFPPCGHRLEFIWTRTER